MKSKTTTAAMKERTELLRKLVALEADNVRLQLRDAEHDAEVATLKRQVVNLMHDRDEQDTRIGWVRSLVDGRQLRPAALHDPKAGRK
jgi:hypothetical protein